MIEDVRCRAPRVSPATNAMRRAKKAQDRYGRGSYNERHSDDDRAYGRNQKRGYGMSGHDYGQGRSREVRPSRIIGRRGMKFTYLQPVRVDLVRVNIELLRQIGQRLSRPSRQPEPPSPRMPDCGSDAFA